MFDYLKKIIKSQWKMYSFLILILLCLSSFEFVLLCIYSCFEINQGIDTILLRFIPTLGVFASMFLTLLMNNYFLESKKEEFSIILLSGCRNREIIFYIIVQFGVLFLIGDFLGGVLGIGLMKIINLYSKYYFYYIYDRMFCLYIAFFICKIIYIYMINFSQFIQIKMSISDYLTHHQQKTSKVSFKIKKQKPIKEILITILAVLMIVFSLQGLFQIENSTLLPIYFIFFLMGELILINTTIPFMYDLLHDSYLLKNPKGLMVLSYVMNLSKVLGSIVYVLSVVVPVCLVVYFFKIDSLAYVSVSNISYIMMLLMMFICFILRFQVYLPQIHQEIVVKKALGFRFKEIQSIYRDVAVVFVLLIDIFPFILYGTMLYLAYLQNQITYNNMLLLSLSYLILFLIYGCYINYQYQKTIKEVYFNVKYINRSE